jgi:hypothetical protein
MMCWQPTDEVDILRFWEVAITVCALVGYVVWKQHRLFGLLPLLGFAFIVFVAFKHGYVRHDGHEVAATNLLLLAALLWLRGLPDDARHAGTPQRPRAGRRRATNASMTEKSLQHEAIS